MLEYESKVCHDLETNRRALYCESMEGVRTSQSTSRDLCVYEGREGSGANPARSGVACSGCEINCI